MSKINNIYVGNAPLISSTGGSSGNAQINVNDYLTNPKRIEDVTFTSGMFNNKLIFGDVTIGGYRYIGYLGVLEEDDESYGDVFQTFSPCLYYSNSRLYLKWLAMDTYYNANNGFESKGREIYKDKTENTDKIFIGGRKDLITL